MNDQQKLDLSKLLKEYQSEETTQKIRELKHSKHIKEDVNTFLKLKNKYPRISQSEKSTFRNLVEKKCNFLYNKYTNIFNKLYNNELDISVLLQFVNVLERIENGELNQHEGSFLVGSILKKLYIDSALRKEKNMETKEKKQIKKTNNNIKNISWNEYKKLNQ
jgi:hypothetical protein